MSRYVPGINIVTLCEKLNVPCSPLTTMDMSELENYRIILKNRSKEICIEIDELLKIKYVLKYKENQAKEKERQKQLQLLSDEQYCIATVDRRFYDEIIKRKRNFMMSSKAMNHGGIYSDAYMAQPRVGMGFRGYKGVTL